MLTTPNGERNMLNKGHGGIKPSDLDTYVGGVDRCDTVRMCELQEQIIDAGYRAWFSLMGEFSWDVYTTSDAAETVADMVKTFRRQVKENPRPFRGL